MKGNAVKRSHKKQTKQTNQSNQTTTKQNKQRTNKKKQRIPYDGLLISVEFAGF